MTLTRPDPADPTHRLPHARAPIDAAVDPFVGNESPDDNLAECAHVALWTAVGAFHEGVKVAVKGGVVTLTGALPSPTHRERAVKAVASLKGVRKVISDLDAGHGDATALSPELGELTFGHAAPQPMICVTRFCSPEEASVSAAIRQGLDEIGAFLALAERAPPQQVHVLYRNVQPHSLTVEVGVVVDSATAARAAGDVHAGRTPSGTYLERRTEPGMTALIATGTRLMELAATTGHHPAGVLWQCFDVAAVSPWLGHPAASVRLPLSHLAAH